MYYIGQIESMGFNLSKFIFMIPRILSEKILSLAQQFPVIGLIGPRQSGKTTLVQTLFKHLPYINLEDINQRYLAQNDPTSFLDKYKTGVVLDEIQNVPHLFSHIQIMVDQNQMPGQFILTGSQNFSLSQHISQTLAGRIALLSLLPLSIQELKANNRANIDYEQLIFQGGYPSLYKYKDPFDPTDWYPNYIKTYVERDVRQIKNITDLNRFQAFLKLCSGRIGQILNLTSLANDCGISHVTAREWISVLETSYLIYLLPPHYQNFSKRLIKMPKIYFYDTGLACSLLGIENKQQLENHYLKGGLFENLVIGELLKYRFNYGKQPNLYFWRDKSGHEVDCIYETAGKLLPIEIKASKSLTNDHFKNLIYYKNLSQQQQGILCYAGDIEAKQHDMLVVNFANVIEAIQKL
jgi:predicted AAA+ superfamily ATPase